MQRRKRCTVCGKLTEKWQIYNGSPVYCYDGCFLTTGSDNRTVDGKPAWEVVDGKKPFDKSRMKKSG